VVVPTTGVVGPRVLPETAVPLDTIVNACPSDAYQVTAIIVAENTDESVEARWFVNYSLGNPGLWQVPPSVINPIDDSTVERTVPPLAFQPFANTADELRVLEVVVAYQFDASPTVPQPNRTPAPGNAAQVFRWVFQRKPPEACPAPAPVP
jgi:hypothetical protein